MNLLQYQPGNSFLHKLNPVTKLLAVFLYCVACIISDSIFVELGLILLMLVICFFAGLGKRALSLTKNLLILGGIILMVLGMMGEYIGRIYMCINATPQYVVREIVQKEMQYE